MPPITRSKAAKTSGSISMPEKSIRESSTPRHRKGKKAPSRPEVSKPQVPTPRSPRTTEPSHTVSALLGESTRVLPDDAITHWPCRGCSFAKGVFVPPATACIFCEHDMEQHELPSSERGWNPNCAYVSQREELVAATIRLALEKGVVVIRATPQVGKSTLLKLLGRHILKEHPSLEPVWIHWINKEKRDGLPYQKFLDNAAIQWRRINAAHRPHNPNTREIFLLDEAQNSYGEFDFWSSELKNRSSASQPLFVLVCAYDSITELLRKKNMTTPSEALSIDQSQRIELRPSVTGGMCMQFTSKETEVVVKKWALDNKYELIGDVCEYMHMATSGHPGMLRMLLDYFDSRFPQLNSSIRSARTWTPETCHAIVSDLAGFMAELERWGRGVWTVEAEDFCKSALLTQRYNDIRFSDVVRAMWYVAMKRDGYHHLQTRFDAFAFCQQMGVLHIEPLAGPDQSKIKYVFPSPIHQRVAYRRLRSGPGPDAALDGLKLLQVCLNAIEGISRSALPNRPNDHWSMPEAALPEEIYRCLCRELDDSPILSEHSHSKSGRVDFYIFDKKWGIAILQSGTKAQIMEHAARFRPGGKYKSWNILDDYIVLSFCSKYKLRNMEDMQDSELQPHIMQVVVDPEEPMTKVYTYDRQLKASLTLGEGRHGSSTGAPDLGMATGESIAQMSGGDGSPVAASYEKNREEARDLLGLPKRKRVESEEAVVPEMSEKRKKGVLRLLDRLGTAQQQ